MRSPLEEITQVLMNNYVDEVNKQLFSEKPLRYISKVVNKYLSIPVPTITKDYDDDSEYGSGEFRGLLFSIRWIHTRIPIGKETIKVPVYKKSKSKTISFKRYGDLQVSNLSGDK